MSGMCGSGGVAYSSERHDWETPQNFFDALNEEFGFDLDAAASAENAKCREFFDEEADGLSRDWGGEPSGATPLTAARSADGSPRRLRSPASPAPPSCCSSRRERTRGGSTTTCTGKPSFGS